MPVNRFIAFSKRLRLQDAPQHAKKPAFRCKYLFKRFARGHLNGQFSGQATELDWAVALDIQPKRSHFALKRDQVG
ncbi:MAG: hypothetical protein Q7J84_02565 [Sulfuricaulis sp.]|nr:hypothetical protein [Sulfuricaulis sp.]